MDEELDNLKKLYQGKKNERLQKSAAIKKEGENQLQQLKNELLRTIVVFVLTALAILYVDYISSKKMETSSAGFWILLSCALYYAGSKVFLWYKLKIISPLQPVLEVVEQSESYKELNTFLLTYGEIIYVMILSIGVYLYLLPVLETMQVHIQPKYLKYLKFIWLAYLVWAFYNLIIIKRKKLIAESKIIERYIESLKANL